MTRQPSYLTDLLPAERRRGVPGRGAPAAGGPAVDARGPGARAAGVIHALFEAQARRTPAAAAVVCGEQSLTYRELDRWANGWAHELRARGVGPEVRVGICMERSLELVAGVLAILKAGGAYLPLDPGYPAERLAFMLADAGAPLLLTQPRLRETLPRAAGAVLCLEPGQAGVAADGPENRTREANLAYVIYTSGSTGRPKGVLVSHGNLIHSTCARLDYYREPITGFLLLSSLAFDSSVAGLFWSLCRGGTLWLPPEGRQADLSFLIDPIASGAISHWLSVPSLYALLLEQAAPERLRALRVAIVAGEACPAALVARHRERLPGTQFFNEYGPTEGTVWSSVYDGAGYGGEERVPIGRPPAGMESYVLGPGGQPVPAGAVGELFIGGAGVARGYLDRPALTAERFVPHPFSSAPGARLYRTGDRARVLPDGQLEFHGRQDHQVKIRGFRIELAEIEAALGQHPAVRESVVLAREDLPGSPRLVAYLVFRPGPAPPIAAVRQSLRERLPDYMQPAAFVVLGALPLTAHGKVDRAALPPPDWARTAPERASVAPRDPVEAALVSLWEALLGVQPIGVTDSFFDLGGHSLLAVRLFGEIEVRWGQKLPPATLLQAPTVAQLARLLHGEAAGARWPCVVPIQPVGTKPPFFCMHGAGPHILAVSALARHLPPDQPFYGIRSRGLGGRLPPHTRVEEMAADYLREIREIQPRGPYYLGGYSFGGQVAFEMAQQLHAGGERVALLAMFNTHFRSPQFVAGKTPFRARVYPWLGRAEATLDRLQALQRRHLDHWQARGPAGYAAAEAKVGLRLLATLSRRCAGHLHPKLALPAPGEDALPPLVREIWRLNIAAAEAYVPRVYDGRVTVFWACGTSPGDPDWSSPLGWNELARDGLELHVVPGDHATFRAEPHVRVLAQKLIACLERAQQAG